jgi:hypothetical protein
MDLGTVSPRDLAKVQPRTDPETFEGLRSGAPGTKMAQRDVWTLRTSRQMPVLRTYIRDHAPRPTRSTWWDVSGRVGECVTPEAR